jgi:hypothetical protein
MTHVNADVCWTDFLALEAVISDVGIFPSSGLFREGTLSKIFFVTSLWKNLPPGGI